MGLCISTPGPNLAPMPTCDASRFQNETQQMCVITQVANQLTSQTYQALNSAKVLCRTPGLSSSQLEQINQACDALNMKFQQAEGISGELAYFNKTFGRWGEELAAQFERQNDESRSLLDHRDIRTKDGYSVESLINEVKSRSVLVTNLANEGVGLVDGAIKTLNDLARAKGAPPIPDVSATWRQAASLDTLGKQTA